MFFVFRVDASSLIGTGHVMRCLTLAEVLRSRGGHCIFVTREHVGHLIGLIQGRGFETFILPHEPHATHMPGQQGHSLGNHWSADADETVAALMGRRPDWIIADHYAIDKRWELRVRPRCHRLAVIDDLANRDHICDLLIDQNVVDNAYHSYAGRVPSTCFTLMGPRFALLQPQYAELHSKARPRGAQIRRILVYFGGADVTNLTGMALDALQALERPEIIVDVVVDPHHPKARSLAERLVGFANFKIHGRLPSLAPLMMAADLAIGAGGATTWERCCLGLPAVIITLAENQTYVARELDRLGALRWLGCKAKISAEVLRNALIEITSSGMAEAWSRQALLLVDGHGAMRVSDLMLLSEGTPLKARRAEAHDEALLMRWANDPLVRTKSFNQAIIHPGEHSEWFKNRLGNKACRIYIFETETGVAVGQVRFELEEGRWLIDYSLDACFRGRGLGRVVLSLAISKLTEEMGLISLMAHVKVDNLVSSRVFESLGFTRMVNEASNSVHYSFTGASV